MPPQDSDWVDVPDLTQKAAASDEADWVDANPDQRQPQQGQQPVPGQMRQFYSKRPSSLAQKVWQRASPQEQAQRQDAARDVSYGALGAGAGLAATGAAAINLPAALRLAKAGGALAAGKYVKNPILKTILDLYGAGEMLGGGGALRDKAAAAAGDAEGALAERAAAEQRASRLVRTPEEWGAADQANRATQSLNTVNRGRASAEGMIRAGRGTNPQLTNEEIGLLRRARQAAGQQ